MKRRIRASRKFFDVFFKKRYMIARFSTPFVNTRCHCLVKKAPLLAGVLVVVSFVAGSALAAPHVFCWGDNTYGQTNVPPTLTNVMAIAGGYYHALALRSNGTVLAWGDNSFGQTNNQPSLTNVMAIDGGAYHSLALRSNSTVYAWGQNNLGQVNVPAGLTNVIRISAGGNHSMALRSNGTVIVWGDNSLGQTNVPPNATNVIAISAGDTHCLALRGNGTVVGWGDNQSGQSVVPANVTNIMTIAAGYHHNLVLRSNGTVIAWGVNVYGETDVPPGLSNVVAVAAGDFHSAALRNDGTVIAWGQDFEAVTNVPIDLKNATTLAAGFDFDLALASLCPPGFPDNFECRQALIGSNVTNVCSTVGATHEPGEPLHGGVACSNSFWFTWTAPASGGTVITAVSDFSFASPILAVYTGNTLATLSSLAFNFVPSGTQNPLNQARVAFTAVQGQTYQIALDGVPTPSSDSQGPVTLSLNLSPPPVNDLFSNATLINGTYYEITNGSFLGAGTEPGEVSAYVSSLWWKWTAPTNLNVSAIPIRLTADSVSLPPGIAVYTGNSIGTLTPVAAPLSTDGMTTTATFSAVPGTTYRISLSGNANDGSSVLPILGNYRFRLNTRALALTILNLVTNTTSSTQSVSFTATARVDNLGSAVSSPMRVRTAVVPGISMRGSFVSPITSNNFIQGTWLLPALSPGQNTNLPISGSAPAPNDPQPGDQSAQGFGVYAELSEQITSNNWAAVDQTLVLYGNWPNLDGLPGPGGGVIRLDPAFIGASAFNPLAAVSVVGPTAVVEGNLAAFSGQGRYYNGFLYNFTNTTWLATLFNITTNGIYTSGGVTSNTVVTVTARYSDSGFVYDSPTNITILNLPPPLLKSPALSGANFILQVSGVSNRVHVVEATTNLSPPGVWLPVRTNTIGPTGLWNFTNGTGSDPQRFYRVREVL